MFTSPIIPTMTTYAAEQQTLPYSTRWETQADGVTWKYRYDSGGYASDRWVRDEVDGNWYLMDENGIMRYGVFTSYGRYYLLSELHDGHFGHMVKNGEVYQGVTIVAEASGEYEGALSADTINALRSAGVNVDNVPDVTGTQHTSNGEDEPTTPPVQTPTENPSTGEGGSTTSGESNQSNTGGGNKPIFDNTEITGEGAICAARRPLVRLPAATRRSPTATFIKVFR